MSYILFSVVDYATLRPHLGKVGGGVGVDLEEEETVVSVLIFCWFDVGDEVEVVSSFLLLFDVWLPLFEEESGFCVLFCEVLLFPAFASASAAFNLTHVSPRAFAKWSSTVIQTKLNCKSSF